MLSLIKEYDVLVCGGGPAGVCAAFASSKTGAHTALVEQYGYLGGMATLGMIGNFLTFHSMRNEQIVAGIGEEIVDRLENADGTFPGKHQKNAFGHAGSVTPYNDEVLKHILFEMAEDYKVDLYLHSFISDALINGNSVCGVILETKSGRRILPSKVVVDATGDGDVAYYAGAKMMKGRETDGKCMAMSAVFKMGGVDFDSVFRTVKKNPEQFKLAEDPYIGKTPREIAATLSSYRDYPLLSGYYNLVKEKRSTGELLVPRQRLIFSFSPNPGFVYVNATNVIGYDGTNPTDITNAEKEVRKQVKNLETFFQRYVPGFEQAFIAASAITIGVRESRRIIGEYILTPEDVLSGKDFEDSIARGGYCIDDHQPDGTIIHLHAKEGKSFTIPYRCLIPLEIENLIVAGRTLSATHVAAGSIRVMAQCMATGHAAGTAAALSVTKNCTPRYLNRTLLQNTLKKQKAIF